MRFTGPVPALPGAFAPAAIPARGIRNRVRRRWKEFTVGRPEDVLASPERAGDRGRGALHLSLVGLLVVPVAVGLLLPPDAVAGRWAALLGSAAGLVTAAQLAVERSARHGGFLLLLAGLIYAMAASFALALVLAPWEGASFPSHTLALLLYAGLVAVIASRDDPALVLSVGAFSAVGYVAVVLFVTLRAGEDLPAAAVAISLGLLGVVVGLGTQSAHRGRQLRRMDLCDGLTGLVGREALEICLRRVAGRCQRHGWPLTLALVDVDQLDRINRSAGHAFGDALLRWVAALLRERCRATDLIGRYDDDTFLVCFVEADHPALARRLASLQEAVRSVEAPAGDGTRRAPTASIGLAALPREAGSWTVALALAEQRLEQAKRAGGNRLLDC